MGSKLGMCIVAVGLTMGLARVADAQAPALAVSTDPIWTDRPVRIDRARQTYQRIPGYRDAYATKFRVPQQVRVIDAASFAVGDSLYLLSQVIAIDPKKICRRDDGTILACGLQSRVLLKKAISGRLLECRSTPVARAVTLVDCRVGQDNLGDTMVHNGYARPVTPSTATARRP